MTQSFNKFMNRRSFLRGCAGFSAAAAVRGFGITNLVFANSAETTDPRPPTTESVVGRWSSVVSTPPNNRDLLVFVFVRGGMDGLNVVIPHNTSSADRYDYYNRLRPTLNIAAPHSSAARPAVELDGKFALHPDAARGDSSANTPNQTPHDTGGLYELFKRGDLAIVHACGSPDVTGSHFDTELFVDQAGTHYSSGWMSRYLQAVSTPQDALVVAPQPGVPPSLSEWYGSTAIPDPSSFGARWHPYAQYQTNTGTPVKFEDEQRALLQSMFNRGNEFVESQGRGALASYDVLAPIFATPYVPSADYYLGDIREEYDLTLDYGSFGRAMKNIAQLAKANLTNPLRVACVDVGGGWDTHDNEGTVDWNGNARFPTLLRNLSTNLKTFCDDMNADPQWRGRYTIAVVSEFGRVLYQNDSAGCDHGSGNVMMLIGSHNAQGQPSVNGGQIYANWPGLQTFGFNDGLAITTDYRRVLADVLVNRMGATADMINNTIFPGLGFASSYGYTGLGLFNNMAGNALGSVRYNQFVPAVQR